MKFGPDPVSEALGAILAHSESTGRGRLRKGRVLSKEDITALAASGHAEVVVAQIEPGDVHEDEAATRLARAVLGDGPVRHDLRASKAATGRVNLYCELAGVAEIDADVVDAINAVDPMITIATVGRWQRMGQGGMVATIKIISYAVPEAALSRAEAVAAGALKMRAPQRKTARLIQTTVAGDDGAKGHQAIEARLDALGVTMAKSIVPHDSDAIAEALRRSDEDLILILTGSATSDIRDTAPLAVLQAGGKIAHYGMPVDPGNLLFLGDLNDTPVIGLPGCARSPALNGADWVLERVICGVALNAEDIMQMGVGGLLKDIPTRPLPRRKSESS